MCEKHRSRTLPTFGQRAVFFQPIRLHVATILNRDTRLGEVAKGNIVMDVVWPKGYPQLR